MLERCVNDYVFVGRIYSDRVASYPQASTHYINITPPASIAAPARTAAFWVIFGTPPVLTAVPFALSFSRPAVTVTGKV